jgi:hypothetical protein
MAFTIANPNMGVVIFAILGFEINVVTLHGTSYEFGLHFLQIEYSSHYNKICPCMPSDFTRF